MSLMNGPFWALRLSWITLAGLGRTRNPSRAKSHNPPDRPCGLDSASCATLLLRNGQTRSQQQIRGEAALPGRESRLPDDADLARSLGVHRSAVVRWKRGEAPAAKNWEQ